MSTVYKINRLCKINTDNPTPCKYSMDVAINIEPVRKNKKFENFVLGMDGYQQCYEDYDARNTLTEDEVIKFVESIEVDADIPDKLYPTYLDCGGAFGVKINIRDEEPIYAWVYNKHNGYYYHDIYYTNGELKIDCWEVDCL